jgi:hypothetical protein
LWTMAWKNGWCCCLHRRKMIGVVDDNTEKCLNLNISTNMRP